MYPAENKINKVFTILLTASFIIRAVLAGLTELGNDEVYYRLYALYPDLSHFDHPPMIGWIIQIFSLNMYFQDEIFLRLGAVIIGTFNTWIIFRIGKVIRDETTGLYAAFLYTGSAYCSVIAGTFIMPDTPQVMFWLLSMWFLIKSLPDRNLIPESRKYLLLAGVMIGLAMLSKYHSVFLIIGSGLYIMLFNRKWFRTKELYLSLLIALVLFLPVLIWNFNNDFISFTFHEERIDETKGINWIYLGREILGQFFYNNPVNFVLIIAAFFALIKKNDFLKRETNFLLLLLSIPLSVIFITFSFNNETLPHWTGPAYLGYILIAASWLSGLKTKGTIKRFIPLSIQISVGLLLIVLTSAFFQIRYGFIPVDADPTTQLTGYEQLGEGFAKVVQKAENEGDMMEKAPLFSERWFPAANFDYYLGLPLGIKVYAFGTMEKIHKFHWINKKLGELHPHSDAWYIGLSDGLNNPISQFGPIFDSIRCKDTILITRGKNPVRQAYIYRMYGLK